VADVVDAIIAAILHPALNTEINIGTGVETSVLKLVKYVKGATNKNVLFYDITERPIDVITRRCLDVKKAEELLHWKPATTIDVGIKKTYNWYAEYIRLSKEVFRTTTGL
jgi:nucleoside-diphosphate-sugar epimerase